MIPELYKRLDGIRQFFKTDKATLVLQMGKRYYKAAIIQTDKKSPVLSRFLKGSVQGDWMNIADALAKGDVQIRDVIIVTTRDQVTVRNIELPTVDLQEIEDIVNIQAVKQTPFSKEEILIDYHVLGSSREHYSHVLLAIAQKAVIDDFLQNFASLKSIQQIVLSSECLTRLSPVIEKQVLEETFAIVDCEMDYYDFCVVSKGKLLFTRVLQFSDQNLEVEGASKQFFSELRDSLDVYQSENIGPAFQHVVLVGDQKATSLILKWAYGDRQYLDDLALTDMLFQVMDEEPLLKDVKFSEEAETMLKLREKDSFVKLIALVPGLHSLKSFINFLPPGIKQMKQRDAKSKEFVRIVFFSFLVLIVAVAAFLEKRFAQSLLLQSLSIQLIKVEKKTAEIRKEKLKIDVIKGHLNVNNSALDVMIKIHKVVPQVIYVSSIDFEYGESFVLRGTAVSSDDVKEFAVALQEVPGFYKVETKYFSERNINDKVLFDFEIKCLLNG